MSVCRPPLLFVYSNELPLLTVKSSHCSRLQTCIKEMMHGPHLWLEYRLVFSLSWNEGIPFAHLGQINPPQQSQSKAALLLLCCWRRRKEMKFFGFTFIKISKLGCFFFTRHQKSSIYHQERLKQSFLSLSIHASINISPLWSYMHFWLCCVRERERHQ